MGKPSKTPEELEQERQAALLKKKSKLAVIWTPYRVTWKFHGNLFGSVPKQEKLIETWLKSRQPKVRAPGSRPITDIQEEVVATMLETPETIEEQMEKVSLGFQHLDNEEIHVRGATIRAHLKDCARYLGRAIVGKVGKEPMLGWQFTNGCYIKEYWIPVKRMDDQAITRPDGTKEIFVHSMGPTGPINAIKNIDFVSNVKVVFTMLVTPNVNLEDIQAVMTYGSVHGYAGERSMGEGQYQWTIEDVA